MDKIEEYKQQDTISKKDIQKTSIEDDIRNLNIDTGISNANPRIQDKVNYLINSKGQSLNEEDEEPEDVEKNEDEQDEESADEDCLIQDKQLIFNPTSQLNKWLKSRGKQHCINFEDDELVQLRNYFNSLDDDGSGSIGVDELEDPLIALGLVDNR